MCVFVWEMRGQKSENLDRSKDILKQKENGTGRKQSKMARAGKVAAAVTGSAVKLIFSWDLAEAKQRMRELYQAWYR